MSKEIEQEELEVEESEEQEAQEEEQPNYEEELEAKDKKIKELEDLIARKKKANKKEPTKEDIQKASNSELSQKELYTLMRNNVHEEDVDEVVEYAKLKNIPVDDALKSSVIKAILKDKEETRKTAEVSNTGTTRKSATSKDADTLVGKARKGDLPDSPEDMVKVFERMKGLDK